MPPIEKPSEEIFVCIIKLLPLNDRLNCILTCSKWNNTITGTTLYDRFRFKSLDKLQVAIKMFQEKPDLGKYVHHLHIIRLAVDKQDLVCLTKIFPNVDLLDWKEESAHGNSVIGIENYSQEVNTIINEAVAKWKYLGRLINNPSNMHSVINILKSGTTYYNLQHIKVSFYGCGNSNNTINGLSSTRFMFKEFVKHIHNVLCLERPYFLEQMLFWQIWKCFMLVLLNLKL